MDDKNLLLLTLLLACVPLSLSQSPNKNNPLRIIHQWTFANFNYNSTQDRQNAEKLGYLLPGNVAILDGDYYIDPKTNKMRIFVATPQFLSGIPATFSEVRDQKREEPVMSPFPSWDAQNIVACSGPISVYRFHIDSCGLLWVLDSGMVETFLVPRRACNPKMLIYDLNDNDKLIDRYDFPADVIRENSIIMNLVPESYQKDCRDSIVYIADVQARGLVIFDWQKRASWRVENSYFYPFPDHGTVRIRNTTFELLDGLFGLALSPATDPQRKLYFHSAASVRESWVLTSVLKNSSIVNDGEVMRREFHHSEDVHEGQSTVEVMTDDGILIYPVLNKNALACWNSAQPLTKEFQYIILEDNHNLQFVSGMKMKNKSLMITSSKLQNYLLFQANGTDVKYRVMMIDNIDELLDNSPCRKGQTGSTTQLPVTRGSTQRFFTTTFKPTTSDPIGNKFFPQKPTTFKTTSQPIGNKFFPSKSPTDGTTSHPIGNKFFPSKSPSVTTSDPIGNKFFSPKSPSVTTTSDPIGNKFFPQKPPNHGADEKQTVYFGHHNQPPFWHPPREQGTLQKQPSHEQIPYKPSHSNNPTFSESKYHSTSNSWNQQHLQVTKLQNNPTSRDSTGDFADGKELGKEKSTTDSQESESRNKPSVFHKPTLIRVSDKSPSYGHPQFNNLVFN